MASVAIEHANEKVTDVAVAIFLKPDGQFLLASRPDGKPYPGYWEFPGGKIEAGESVHDALVRELVEELDVTITRSHPWFTFIMRYTHATVRLHCWRVLEWTGDMRGMEGQRFAWQRIEAIDVAPTLPGCVPIFKALSLPTNYWITNASEMGEGAYLDALSQALSRRPSGGVLLQVREKAMSHPQLRAFATRVVAIARPRLCKVLLNARIAMALELGLDGVHLSSSQLDMPLQTEVRQRLALIGASAHTRDDIEHAARLGADFCVLGSVTASRSHPGFEGIGWPQFADIALDAPVPVFAIGGMYEALRDVSVAHGAHGLAMQRAAF
jgi:8-oxo-dGTP diphosphatase